MIEQNLPKWTFDDAYVDFDHENFKNALKEVDSLLNKIDNMLSEEYKILDLINLYESSFDGISSLRAFCRCKLSENTKNDKVAMAEEKIQKLSSRLENIKEILFKNLLELDENDKIWENEKIDHWKFLCNQYKHSWKENLNPSKRKFYTKIEETNFIPLYSCFTHLNNLLNVQAKNQNGELKDYNLSKCAGILKGSSDPVLRKNISYELTKHYDKYASNYVDILNMLHGFRLNKIKDAGVDFKTPSYEQNRISAEAINAMYQALQERIEKIREFVLLRAKHLGREKMLSSDLLAPSPYSSKDFIPYEKAISIICEALNKVSPEISDFINLMLEKKWIEAEIRDNKAGGAFYTRFNCFKQPRVFSTYMGTQAHLFQQAHELGHAWHYWIMRDMPTLKTEFPMSLTEIASTFNEAAVRDHLKKTSQNEKVLFEILWQELKAAANFMLHISVRYDFEISMIEARNKQILTPKYIQELLVKAWKKWYGDSTEDMELFLPYFKLHFYKTDQYIYNYPYTVGYLISQFLINNFRQNNDNFITKYKAFLQDSGQMSVDDILLKHFNKDIKSNEFWLECIDGTLLYIDQFKQVEKQIK